MVEMILAGVIVGAVAAAAVITAARDRRMRHVVSDEAPVARRSEPIPGGWHAAGGAGQGGITSGMGGD